MKQTQTGAELPHLDGVEHRFINLPGLRMHVAEAGSGEPVVLLHGFPQHWWEWRDVIPGLAEQYRVICPDLRGCGWTDAPPDGYTRDQFLADVVALLDALGLDRVRLISHDLGAIPAFSLCIDHPERVVSHVAIAVPPPFIRFHLRLIPVMRYLWFQVALAIPGLGPRLAGGGKQRLPRWLFHRFSPHPEAWTGKHVDAYIAQLREPDRAHAGSAVYRHLVVPEFLRILRGSYRSRRLEPPTLLLFGRDDPAFTPGLIDMLLRDRDKYADQVEVAFVDGAGHFLPDEAPQQVLSGSLEFFARPRAA
jgi:pimeloyl-ACP methyl ester carboxylesterase